MNKYEHRLQVMISDSMFDDIKKQSQKLDMTCSMFVRYILVQHIQQMKRVEVYGSQESSES